MSLNPAGQAARFLIEFCASFDGLDHDRLAELAQKRGYDGVASKEISEAIVDLQDKLRLEGFARGVGGEIGHCLLHPIHSQLSDKDICYFILGKDGTSYHPLQVALVRERAKKLS